jgi:hypothetical protein
LKDLSAFNSPEGNDNQCHILPFQLNQPSGLKFIDEFPEIISALLTQNSFIGKIFQALIEQF